MMLKLLSISKYCRHPNIFLNKKHIVRFYQSIPKNGLIKPNATPIFKGRSLFDNLKIKHFLKSDILIRYGSNISNKNRKTIKYWLFTSSGKVFISIFVALIAGYYALLLSICTILSEVIKRTVR